MAKKQNKRRKKEEKKSEVHNTDIKFRDISRSTGIAIGPYAQSTVYQSEESINADEIAKAFANIENKLASMPDGSNKNIAQNAVKALEDEARLGEQATEFNVEKWLTFLAETAPDAWEVAVDTFVNPIKGVGTVFRKIAKRVKDRAQEAKKAGE